MSFRSDKESVADGRKLGFRSPLVLAKIGYDLRAQYQQLLEQPIPDEMAAKLQLLLGPGAEVENLDAHKRNVKADQALS